MDPEYHAGHNRVSDYYLYVVGLNYLISKSRTVIVHGRSTCADPMKH